jgi:hypothetical protein
MKRVSLSRLVSRSGDYDSSAQVSVADAQVAWIRMDEWVLESDQTLVDCRYSLLFQAIFRATNGCQNVLPTR